MALNDARIYTAADTMSISPTDATPTARQQRAARYSLPAVLASDGLFTSLTFAPYSGYG
jgi:hypothetical protein